MLDQLTDSRAGRALLALAQPRDDVWLVGGAVRDRLLGGRPRELDVAVESDVDPLARQLAHTLGGRVRSHGAFETATVSAGDVSVDLARARTETYPAPGALPVVAPASLRDDLRRRDFTVNAIAVALGGPVPGKQVAVDHALEDLSARRLRVLHAASFIDDPTRLLRLTRYAARLPFAVDEHTERLALQAIDGGALATVSGARVGAELRLILAEPPPVALVALVQLERLGALRALLPGLTVRFNQALQALDLLGPGARADLVILASLAAGVSGLRGWLQELDFVAGDRDAVAHASTALPGLQEALRGASLPSQLFAIGAAAGPLAVALAGADGAEDPARVWLHELRHTRLAISGDDLLAAGMQPGPELGRRLRATLARRMDGELKPGRDAELADALWGTWRG